MILKDYLGRDLDVKPELLAALDGFVKCDYCDDPAAMQITRMICGVKYEWHTCPTHRTSFDLRSTTAKPSEVVVTYLGWAS